MLRRIIGLGMWAIMFAWVYFKPYPSDSNESLMMALFSAFFLAPIGALLVLFPYGDGMPPGSGDGEP